jgi:hypothetical protein
MLPIRTVVCPLDFSEPSNKALQVAIDESIRSNHSQSASRRRSASLRSASEPLHAAQPPGIAIRRSRG